MAEDNATTGSSRAATNDGPDERPVYRKPKLRRYDQIEQVKPYGPSEV